MIPMLKHLSFHCFCRVISGAMGGHSGRSDFWTQRAGSRKTNCSSPILWARGSAQARHWHGLSFSSSLQVKFFFNEVNFNSFQGENGTLEDDQRKFLFKGFFKMKNLYSSKIKRNSSAPREVIKIHIYLHLHVYLKCSHYSFGTRESLFLSLFSFLWLTHYLLQTRHLSDT